MNYETSTQWSVYNHKEVLCDITWGNFHDMFLNGKRELHVQESIRKNEEISVYLIDLC